jgi:multidrug efflux system outer membrane protein
MSLTGAQGFASPSLGSLLSSATQNFGLGFLFSIPGLDGGRHKARVRSARADLSLASAQYCTQLLTALRDVDSQLSAVRILGDRAETLRSIAEDDQSLVTMLQARYANGLISQLDYVDGQRVILEHRRNAVQVNVARYVATVGLIRALGGRAGERPRRPRTAWRKEPEPSPAAEPADCPRSLTDPACAPAGQVFLRRPRVNGPT